MQSDRMCADKFSKNKTVRYRALSEHATIQATLAYLFVAQWTDWVVPLVIGVSHFLITRVRDKNLMIFNQAKDIEYWAAFQGRLIYLYSLVLLIPEDRLRA